MCHMLKSTLHPDGQTTVPPEIRKALNAPAGTVLEWTVHGSEAKITPVTPGEPHRKKCDYEKCLEDLKASPAIPDDLLVIRRSQLT
jgi:bifunctional DNA-binding transcriptional regulator/antitoxin component of YhaV-PrlF toxin-antitoxin module